jgi:hypothetical protein
MTAAFPGKTYSCDNIELWYPCHSRLGKKDTVPNGLSFGLRKTMVKLGQ